MTVTDSDDDEGISQHVEDTDGIPDGDSEDIYREDLDYGLIAVLKSEMDGDIDVNIFERTPNGNVENVYSSSHPNDFPKKKQIHREIGNQVKGSVQFTEAEYAKVEVEDFFERLHRDSPTVDLKHPEVSTILESTRSVQIWDGDPATITVKIDWNEKIGVLEFQQDEFTTDSPRAFKNKFFGAFFKTPKLGKDEWMAIRDVWEQRKTVVGQTGVDDDKLVATEVLEMLKRRVDPTTDRDMLSNGKDKALFDGGNEHGFGGLTVDEDVLWVQSSLIKTAIESAGETRQELQMVSRKLQEMRAMYGSPTTIRAGSEGVPQRFWPLDPVMVAVSEEFIEDAEDAADDSDDTDPDDGSDTDDGDDGDDGPGDDPDGGSDPDDGGDSDDDDDDSGGEGGGAETADGDSSEPTSITADPDAEEGFTADDLEDDANESDDVEVDTDDTDTADAGARRPPAGQQPSDSKPAGDGTPADVAAEINAIEDGTDGGSQDGDPMTDGGVPTAPTGGDSPEPPEDYADPFDKSEWEHVNEHDGPTDVYRVFGAPGAGKTRELKRGIHREVHEFDKGHEDILFCTFTRSGRAEAEDDLLRIFDPTDDETEDAVKRRAKTVHGATLRAVVEADLITPPEDVHLSDVILYNQATDTGFYQDFADEYELPFSEDITNPIRMTREEIEEQKAANAIFSLYSWLKLERLPLKKFPRAPINCPLGQRRTYEMLQAWEEWKQSGYDYEVYEHVDYIDLAIENGVTPDASVLLLDEFQDLSPQEYALFQVWRDSGVIDRIYIAGDQHQCIPEGTPVQTPGGPVPIEEITEGDKVMTAYAHGKAEPFEVTHTHERPATEPVVSLTAESGATVSCTRNHELFTALPNQRQSNGDIGDRHFVYVMKSMAGDYRVGITQMPRKRFSVENGACALMIVGAHDSKKGALVEEKQIAYGYGIPQTPFKTRGGIPQSALNELYDGLNTKKAFHDLCKDKGLDPEKFHLIAQSDDTTTSEYQIAGERVRVSLKLGQVRERKNGPDYVYHLARAVTANDDAIDKLRETSLNDSDAKSDGSVRFRLQSSDYTKVREAAQEAVDALHEAGVGAELCEEATYGSFDESGGRRVPLSVVPASQVTEGMYVPVVSDGSVEYEQVVDRTERKESTRVYDLTVPPTHNYVVGEGRGVAVHNSIYSFRGGDPENFVETPVTYQKSVGESWRCPEPVVDAARTVIERGPGDDPDDFAAKFDSGVAERVSLPDSYSLAESVRESVKAPSEDEDYRQVYLLARTNYQVGRICSALNAGGVPFSGVTDNMNPWDGELVCALHVLRALRDDEPVPAEPLDYLLDGRVSAHEKRTTNLRLQVGQGDADTYPTTAVWAAFTDCDTLEEIAGKLDATEYQHEMLEAAIDTDAPINPKYVKVGTIHASKGSEAPVVYLFNSGSKRIFESTMADESRQAEEHRVAYVGATRASNELYVVDDYFDDTYTLAGVPGGASL